MRERPSQKAILGTALALLLLALFGTYWDDAWHTDKGRDTFWSPPHLVLYAGIGLAGTLVGLHALLMLREERDVSAVLRRRGLVVALIGAAWTLAGAPIDDVWHRSFGRDAVLWSPPHTMGLIGVLLLVGGVTLELSTLKTRGARRLSILGHAGILAVLASLVFEYDSDVPQFSLLWYLPVLAAGTLFAVRIIRLVSDDPWAATKASLAYTLMMGIVITFLLTIHASIPLLPLVALATIAHDAIAKRWHQGIAAVAYVIIIFATYPLYASLFHIGIGQRDILVGFAIALAAAVLVFAATRRPSSAVAGVATIVVLLIATPFAAAHDPGQGPPLGEARLRAHAQGNDITLDAQLSGIDCASYSPKELVARRAGGSIFGRLDQSGTCAYRGTATLPGEGRWFLYLQLQRGDSHAEAWIPIVMTGGEANAERTAVLYDASGVQDSNTKLAAGTLIYAANAALVVAFVLGARHASKQDAGATSVRR